MIKRARLDFPLAPTPDTILERATEVILLFGNQSGVHCPDTRPETSNTLRGESYRLTGPCFLGFLRRRLNFGQASQAM
jgi:hypothetical protein